MESTRKKIIFLPKNLKRRFSFKEDNTSLWEKCPKLDASLSKVSKGAELSFEDTGSLKEPKDRKAEGYLKKAWEACSANFKPALATTCVARILDLWLKQLRSLLESDTPKEEILEALPTLNKAVSSIADASTEYEIYGQGYSLS